jgi:NDP-sugar pyrophosphorylase family protein
MHAPSGTDFRGIILAGVHRWGESAFEQLLPRPLMPVADSPLICYALRWLRDAGIGAATICANSESRLVRRCLGDGEAVGFDLCYYEDRTPRGPAGSVRDGGLQWPADHFVVIEASTIPLGDLGDLLAAHTRSGAAITVVVGADHEPGQRPNPQAQPVGVYVFSRRVLSAVPPTGYQDLKEVLIPRLYAQGESVLVYAVNTACPRITNMDTYLAANDWMIDYLVSGVVDLPGYRSAGPARVHGSARVADSARLIGPTMIGPHSRVGPGANIVGPSVIGQGCRVEADAVISRSVLWDACRIGAGAVVDRSILAFGAQLDAGTRSDNQLHVGNTEFCEPHGATALEAVPSDLRRATRAAATVPADLTSNAARLRDYPYELLKQHGHRKAGLHVG